MKQVSEIEFNQFVKKHNAIPDGFKINGSYTQSKFLDKGMEIARISQDGHETIYEIID